MVTSYCAIRSRDRDKVIWSILWKTLTSLLLKQQKGRVQGSFVPNNTKKPKDFYDIQLGLYIKALH